MCASANMTDMTDAPSSYSKSDIEQLVRDLVPPIVETAVDRAMSRVQATLATDIAKGVTNALNEQNAKLGIDTTSVNGIREAQRRNGWVEDQMSKREDTERLRQWVEDMRRNLTPDDMSWLRDSRRRSEQDAKTMRETMIRWAIPALLGALVAITGVWWREQQVKVAVAPMPVVEADRGKVIVKDPVP